MTKTSCIIHPARSPMTIIRAEYLLICEGNYCAAAILNLLEHLTNSKLDEEEQAEIRNLIAAKQGLPQEQLDDLWIYKTQPEFQDELLRLFGETAIAKALTFLKGKGFIECRQNPNAKWDRTIQYRFAIDKVQVALDPHIVKSRDAVRKTTASKHWIQELEALKNTATIPESVETTTKTLYAFAKTQTRWALLNALIPCLMSDLAIMQLELEESERKAAERKVPKHADWYYALLKEFNLKHETITKSGGANYWKVAAELCATQFPVDKIPALHEYIKAKAKAEEWKTYTVNTFSKYAAAYLAHAEVAAAPRTATSTPSTRLQIQERLSDEEIKRLGAATRLRLQGVHS